MTDHDDDLASRAVQHAADGLVCRRCIERLRTAPEALVRWALGKPPPAGRPTHCESCGKGPITDADERARAKVELARLIDAGVDELPE